MLSWDAIFGAAIGSIPAVVGVVWWARGIQSKVDTLDKSWNGQQEEIDNLWEQVNTVDARDAESRHLVGNRFMVGLGQAENRFTERMDRMEATQVRLEEKIDRLLERRSVPRE